MKRAKSSSPTLVPQSSSSSCALKNLQTMICRTVIQKWCVSTDSYVACTTRNQTSASLPRRDASYVTAPKNTCPHLRRTMLVLLVLALYFQTARRSCRHHPAQNPCVSEEEEESDDEESTELLLKRLRFKLFARFSTGPSSSHTNFLNAKLG